MKFTVIDSSVSGNENKLNMVLEIITQTLSEFDDVEIENINLAKLAIPYYSGENLEKIELLVNGIKDSKGIIFASAANSFTPNALMLNFTEHLLNEKYAGVLKDKNCLIAVTSDSGGERAAAEILSCVISSLSGYDSGRILIGSQYLNEFSENSEIKSIIERQTEDYYRVIRQNRKFFIPTVLKEAPKTLSGASIDKQIEPMTEEQIKQLFGDNKVVKYKTEDIYEKYNLNMIGEEQENNISELSKLFAKKYSRNDNDQNLIPKGIKTVDIDYSNSKPRAKTCKQITQSLPHHFKPQLANGLDAVFQLVIKGSTAKDSFEGYLVLKNNECEFLEGQAEHIDITIMADEKAWLDILTGKNTAQKAFMIGKIKVRGNFIFLSKLDQVFNFSSAVG